MGLSSHTLGDRFQQPGLAHPSLAHHERDMSVAARGALPTIIQECQLSLTSDNRTGSCGVSSCESAFDCALAKHLPDRNRVAEALDCVLSQERKFKKIIRELMRRRANKDAAGLRQRLKPGRQIGRIADNCLLSRRADACCASRNDETRGDAHACLQRSSIGLPQPPDLLHDFQTGPDGAISRVLLRLRKTKIHQDAVAKVLRDMSFESVNRRDAGFAILAQQLDQIFRI